MFRTLIYPSSGAYDYSVELSHWSCVFGSMCVGFSVWFVWSGIRVAGNYVYIEHSHIIIFRFTHSHMHVCVCVCVCVRTEKSVICREREEKK